MKDVLTPFFPCGQDELVAYLRRDKGETENDTQRMIRAANHAAGYLDARTRRRLVARTYREAIEWPYASTLTANSDVVTGEAFSDLKELDEVVGIGLAPGSRVLRVDGDTQFLLDRKAVTDGTVTLTFGSERLQVDGTGRSGIYLPERPLSEVYDAAYLDAAGDEVEIDLTGHRIDRETGYLLLASDVFPEGELNILIGCEAGYREPSATTRGDFADWTAIQHMHLRLAQIYFLDETRMPGRVVDSRVAQIGSTVPDFRMPADVEEFIRQYARLW